MKILITGGAGFIGFNIAKILSLNNNNEIHIIDNLSKLSDNNEFNDYAVSEIKKPVESALEIIAFSCLGLAIIVLVTEIVMKWI